MLGVGVLLCMCNSEASFVHVHYVHKSPLLSLHKQPLFLGGGSFKRTLQSANPAQRSCRAGPPVYIGWNLYSLAVRYGYSA
jgi:hypothetical protein